MVWGRIFLNAELLLRLTSLGDERTCEIDQTLATPPFLSESLGCRPPHQRSADQRGSHGGGSLSLCRLEVTGEVPA